MLENIHMRKVEGFWEVTVVVNGTAWLVPGLSTSPANALIQAESFAFAINESTLIDNKATVRYAGNA